MTDKTPRIQIRLELTPHQKEQIRQATGRDVNTLELGLEATPEAAQPPVASEMRSDAWRRR